MTTGRPFTEVHSFNDGAFCFFLVDDLVVFWREEPSDLCFWAFSPCSFSQAFRTLKGGFEYQITSNISEIWHTYSKDFCGGMFFPFFQVLI